MAFEEKVELMMDIEAAEARVRDASIRTRGVMDRALAMVKAAQKEFEHAVFARDELRTRLNCLLAENAGEEQAEAWQSGLKALQNWKGWRWWKPCLETDETAPRYLDGPSCFYYEFHGDDFIVCKVCTGMSNLALADGTLVDVCRECYHESVNAGTAVTRVRYKVSDWANSALSDSKRQRTA